MPEAVQLFGASISPLTMSEAVAALWEWIERPGETCRYVVTPNVDHLVTLQHHYAMRCAYAEASLVLADGAPVVWASRLLKRPLPERVAGSDLVPALLAAARQRRPLTVFLLGAAPGVADKAADAIEAAYENVRVVGRFSPPLGFERDDSQNDAILARISEARPDVLIVGLGAPKQELWIHRHAGRIGAPVALCVGATIDFLAGNRRRAPRWMRRSGLEWCHRLFSEPRRMCGRYFRDALIFPQMLWSELTAQSPRMPAR